MKEYLKSKNISIKNYRKEVYTVACSSCGKDITPDQVEIIKDHLFVCCTCKKVSDTKTKVQWWIPYLVTDCSTVEEFAQKYHKPDRYQERGIDYVEAVLMSHNEDIRLRGYTIITNHDSITGKCVSYTPDMGKYMTYNDKLNYCRYVLENNTFRKNEVDYYKGFTDKNPHGIDKNIWNTTYWLCRNYWHKEPWDIAIKEGSR